MRRKTYMKVAYMVGPLLSTSFGRDLIETFTSLAPEGVEFVDLDIGSLPLYNRDYDGNRPRVAIAFEEAVDKAGGAVIIMPGRDHIYSATIASATEWSSRPWGTASLEDKPVALAGVSPSPVAMGIVQTHPRGPLTFFGSKFYPHEAHINTQQAGVTSEGGVAEGSHDLLAQFIGGFVDFVKASK